MDLGVVMHRFLMKWYAPPIVGLAGGWTAEAVMLVICAHYGIKT